jgi:hypothetical protein
MDYQINFYPEKRGDKTMNVPVRMSIAYAGKRLFYYTDKRCNLSQWDYESDKPRLKRNQVTQGGQTTTNFNADLEKLSVIVNCKKR